MSTVDPLTSAFNQLTFSLFYNDTANLFELHEEEGPEQEQHGVIKVTCSFLFLCLRNKGEEKTKQLHKVLEFLELTKVPDDPFYLFVVLCVCLCVCVM